MKQRQVAYPLAIYYDQSCPLCAEEMHTLKRYDAHERLRLIDCSVPEFADADTRLAGISRNALMQRIHARDAAGLWLDGVAVFEVAYAAVGINAVVRLWGYPRLQPLWDRIYMWVARNRMWLSRFGLNKAYGQFVRFAARRAERRSVPCAGQRSCPVNSSAD